MLLYLEAHTNLLSPTEVKRFTCRQLDIKGQVMSSKTLSTKDEPSKFIGLDFVFSCQTLFYSYRNRHTHSSHLLLDIHIVSYHKGANTL